VYKDVVVIIRQCLRMNGIQMGKNAGMKTLLVKTGQSGCDGK
jgi:hypothetical protein